MTSLHMIKLALIPVGIAMIVLSYAVPLYFFVFFPNGPTQIQAGPQGASTQEEIAGTHELLNHYTTVRRGSDLADLLYQHEDFEAVEKGLAEAFAKIGTDEGSYYYSRMVGVIAADANVLDVEKFEALMERWIAAYPDSHYPYLIRGDYYISVAWYHRGASLGHDVTLENMNSFRDFLQKSAMALLRAQEMKPSDPESSSHLITIAMALRKYDSEMEKYFRAAIKACPHHLGARLTKMYYLTPRWGGSTSAMLDFADECDAVAEDHPLLGIIRVMYEEDLDIPVDGIQQDVLKEPEVWLHVAQVYHRAIESMEDPLPLQSEFCSVAYRAGQLEAAVAQFKIIGDRWVPAGHWRNLRHYHRARALAYSEVGLSLGGEAGRELLKDAVRLNPTTHEPYARYGHFLIEDEEYEKAEALLLRAVDLAPLYSATYFDLCEVYEGLNRYDESLKYAKRLRNQSFSLDTRADAKKLIARYKRLDN